LAIVMSFRGKLIVQKQPSPRATMAAPYPKRRLRSYTTRRDTIVATAIAAFLQIRHVRNTNEITVYLKLSDRLEALGAPGAFTAIDPFLDRLATDATLRLRLAQPGFVEEFVIIAAVLRVLGQSAT